MSGSENFRRVVRIAAWGCGLLGVVIFGVFVFTSRQIGSDVRQATKLALQSHAGDNVEALIAYVEDSNHSFQQRNRAVWALGQLGDRRALPVLRKHFSGRDCDHANALCQRELKKAIQLVDGGFNATALVWRR